jgi:hypothetical protein
LIAIELRTSALNSQGALYLKVLKATCHAGEHIKNVVAKPLAGEIRHPFYTLHKRVTNGSFRSRHTAVIYQNKKMKNGGKMLWKSQRSH